MSDRRFVRAFVASTLAALAAGLAPGCYGRNPSDEPPPNPAACTGCHGDPTRSKDKILNAAPPRDLEGNTAVGYAGVGAHQNHLQESETHLALACTECHIVPKDTRDKGHADTARPAELTFGALATTGGLQPKFDPATLACTDTYCHRQANPRWLAPRNSADACGSCHGIPPAGHDPSYTLDKCYLCHSDTMGQDGKIKDKSKHVNGVVDAPNGCTACHGGGDIAAPPKDLSGNTDTSAIGVGAHRIHVEGLGKGAPVACETCHKVPKSITEPGHTDSPPPAEVTITGVGSANGYNGSWNHDTQVCSNTWCHGPDVAKDSPVWTSGTGGLGCTSCHGYPPPWPHVQMTQCSRCHAETVGADNATIKDPSKHVNGTIDVVPLTQCTDCHGTPTTPGDPGKAPPKDLAGNSATTSPGVGAHQSHLVGTQKNGAAWHRQILCADCHQVPTSYKDVGHIDTMLPAELTFGALAKTNGANPTYTAGKCENVYCHGAKLKSNIPGGPITSPEWTKVDGTQTACGGAGSCHGFPPAGHPPIAQTIDDCVLCHQDVVDGNGNIINPDKHIDGKSIFDIPDGG